MRQMDNFFDESFAQVQTVRARSARTTPANTPPRPGGGRRRVAARPAQPAQLADSLSSSVASSIVTPDVQALLATCAAAPRPPPPGARSPCGRRRLAMLMSRP